MKDASPFAITDTLHEGGGTVLLRGVRTADHLPVILKVLDPRCSRPRDLERLKREYEIGRQLDLPAIVKPLSLETHEGMPALVLEDFGGQSLDHFLGAPLPIERFLDLAVRIAAAVGALHRRGIIHKDLKPQNILVNVSTGQVKLADFGLAVCPSRERQAALRPNLIEGSLPYLAPEQTGRMNRAIDSRADLYALGVTFYEMLTGRLPFEAEDPLEWVHCHVARVPQPPSALVPGLPEVLSALVVKLLCKMAEDRYQTARGLQYDLDLALAQWRAKGRLEPFPLAENDVSGRLEIPQKLYGREEEIAALLSAFERVVGTAVPELVLVSGYSGIGKSALVQELDKPVIRERGFFASGKFDQYKRDVPYSTLVQAFRELVLAILAESEDRIAKWKERLLGALAINAQIIVDVIREVELVIGWQPPAPELPPMEAQNRFRMVFRHFIGVFAQKEHPLALFLDDLQWADSASLGLLQDLVTYPETRDLLVVGAYRDNEVSPTHPLMLALDKIRKEGARVSDIVLGPLSGEHVVALVSDALHCRREDAVPLAELVHEKTAGNPFFALQFLAALHEERLIEFDAHAGAFRWDVAKAREKGFTGNVVDLVVGKLARLPESTQEAVQTLACLGNTAEVTVLATVSGRSEEASHADLWEAVRAGLILRMADTYKFPHDRIQEAAYSLIPESERAAVHLEIGRLLSARTPPEELEENIFEIVNQLNRGATLITTRGERERVAELNLVASKRAKGSTAYASSLKYLAAGSALLEEDRWERRYELTFALEFHRAECEFLTGYMTEAEERLSTLSRRAGNLVNSAAVACARMALYLTLDRTDRTIEVCLEYLRRVGVEWSPRPAEDEVRQEYERLWQKLGSRAIEELIDLPPLTDPAFRATMTVLMECLPPAMFSDQNLLCLIIGRMGNLSLEHGNSDASCYAYVWLGMILGPRFGDYRAAFRFGKLGFDLVETRGLDRFKARVYLGFWHSVNPWTRHVRTGREGVRQAFDAAQEAGDITFAAYCYTTLITDLLAVGDPLGDVQQEAENGLEFVRRAKFGLIVDTIMGQLGLIRTLRGLTPDLASFNDATFDEGRFERHLEGDPRLSFASCSYWTRKLQARFFAGDHASAITAASKVEPLLWTVPSQLEVAEYHFYGALALAAHDDAPSAQERALHREALVAHHKKLEVWADNCPENFENRAALVAAEIARIDGEWDKAAQQYERAIRSARDNGFVQNEAIAYETAARFYRGRGYELIADTYLREARARYLRWGADGKVARIDQQAPHLLEPRALAPTATFVVRPEQLDLLSVTKASQTISSEITFDKLVRTLLTVVLEQGGAQRACLVLSQSGSLSIEAEAALEERGAATCTLGPLPVDSSQRIPVSVVHYVHRTKERVILGNAAADAGKFSGDEHFARRRPKSVLCMPILRQAEVVGLLYLENNLLAGAFTPDRLVALSLLATQAAISLEKAQLLGKEQAARAAAEAAERRAMFIAEAGALLSESLDYTETLGRLARLCVESISDWCVIDVVKGGEIRRIAGAHKDPMKAPLLEELQRRYPPRWNSPHAASRVLRTGQPILIPELSEEVIGKLVVDDEHLRLSHALGAQSSMIVPLVSHGQTLGVLSVVSAAPERRYGRADLVLVEEVARRAAVAIDNARLYRKTQEAVRVRDEFLTVASHELNTPVTSLRLTLQSIDRAIRSGWPADTQAMCKMVERALRQGTRLARLNKALVDVSQLHAGRLPLEREEVDLATLIRNAIDQLKPELSQARCTVDIQDGEHVVGYWDPDRIEQIVTNLLSNAAKFGAGKPIEVFYGENEGIARIVVHDHGIGIDPARQERIFDRFERAASENYGGLGLGLYISRRIAEAHGGTLRVQSEPGVGSSFTLELPRVGRLSTVC
ncbi:sensor histidine kinase [Polyangium jinanense]|uniref:histidine kinase n=1 Tax=Polyangium jinanense TaxID=2829994 RepID=A0A9X3XE31_9BACT|nr:ATP-binding sensor histidine kinase [Polyangium jinanense]MDC3961351.1 AAA family ATPase [Polyangium jinanense]MDC3987730.1 AAA family ATPase [Polyangium jinanense]